MVDCIELLCSMIVPHEPVYILGHHFQRKENWHSCCALQNIQWTGYSLQAKVPMVRCAYNFDHHCREDRLSYRLGDRNIGMC
jgi:hypothetical protein